MNVLTRPDLADASRGRNVTAVLGPTNTGKTHLAIERMLAHPSGVIGLPLRLLAREVYNRIVQRIGPSAVALITGEEKIGAPDARYRVCTVEALPSDTTASFLAIDEVQLAADLERGHVFTDRILNLRGRDETLLLGAATMRGTLERLIPGVNVVIRPRLSLLTYSGQKKITRLPRRSAAVAFSADEVYAIGELIRRQRGGVAVVLGALSPRTRNAQVELFQSGDVDFLVATDAIGMGLNLDLEHVAFASDRKFDGYQYRRLNPSELAQIAGRAGRHTTNGTFGVTAGVEPFDDELVEALESHRFQPVKLLQWRNRDLDFSSVAALRLSLDRPPGVEGLAKAPPADDAQTLEAMNRDLGIRDLADRPGRVALLWDVCQVPDYRKIAPANHAELVSSIFRDLATRGTISEDWFARQISHSDRTDGDIDTLAARIAQVRTWTYAANRPLWFTDQAHWQERTRAIEDRLSDALHERLTQRFVDRRTSVLLRRLREKTMLDAEINDGGDVLVEGQHVGRLEGFRFVPDPGAGGPDAKAIRAAAQKSLAGEIGRRAEGVARAGNEQFVLSSDGTLRWQGLAVARMVEGDDVLKPRLVLLADEELTGAALDAVRGRLDQWLATHLDTLLKPLFELRSAEALPPLARGIAFRLSEGLGVVERAEIAEDVRGLDQEMRAGLRKLGVRFGAYHIYVPALLKPAPSSLLAMLWGLKNGGFDVVGIAELPQMSSAGRTTIPVDPAFAKDLYRVVGYRIAGPRAIRLDILERLADLIRPLLAWRPTAESSTPPDGVAAGGFTVTPAMTSLLGASGDDFGAILKSLGYRMDRRPAPPKPAAPAPVPDAAEAAATPAPEVAAAADDAAPAEIDAAAVDAVTAPADPVDAPAVDAAAPAEADPAPVDVVAAPADPVEIPAGDAAAEIAPTAEDPAPPAAVDSVVAAEPAADAAAADTPAEPAMIEVWRPGGRGGDRNRGPRRDAQRQGRGRDGGQRHAPAEAAAVSADGQPAAQPRPEGRPPRADQRPRDRKEWKARPPENRRRSENHERSQPPQRPSPPPKPRDRPVDPDSPFAALAALKASLEARKPE